MKLSIIIPVYNRDVVLTGTLPALARQTLPAAEFEVVVVNDGSSQLDLGPFSDLEPAFRFTFVSKDHGGLASARNHGAAAAVGEILWFLDDDVVPEPNTARQHLLAHQAASTPSVVVGSLPFPESVRRNPFVWYLDHSDHFDLYRNPRKYKGDGPPLAPMNGNSSIPHELFEQIGRYDESFAQYGGEDLELGYRLTRAGVPFVYNPLAIGVHHHSKDFRQFCTDQERAGESLIHIYRRYPEIGESKKIDIVEGRFLELKGRKKIVRLVLSATMRVPGILGFPGLIIRMFGKRYEMRYLLFPLYRWISHYHYALGMRNGLAATQCDACRS